MQSQTQKRKVTGSVGFASLTHQARFTVTWIEFMMCLKPVMMMAWMVRVFVSYTMYMTLVDEEVCMLVCICSDSISCYGTENIRKLTYYTC